MIEVFPYRQEGDFGFTTDARLLKAAEQFRDAASADGWGMRATYGSESIDRASTLWRGRWSMMILTRNNESDGRGKKYEASVHIWAHDRLAVEVPEFYDFAELQRRTRVCSNCKAEDVETQRFSFAGRCCEACLPKMRAATEQPGWCD